MHLAVGKIPVLQLAGASRHDDTGRKLDTLDLSGQKYVSAYDRPISVLTRSIVTEFVAKHLAIIRVQSPCHVFDSISDCLTDGHS